MIGFPGCGMKLAKLRLPAIAVGMVAVFCVTCGREQARGELRWEIAKRQPLQVRLIALELSDPRSSFFSSHEVFVAAQQMGPSELRLVKLVYEFLPYQPRLSEYGMSYSTLHEIMAVRDPNCDETLAHLTGDDKGRVKLPLDYSPDAPPLNVQEHHNALPCFDTSATDYTRAIHRPASKDDRF
jgi:hypothetical protein